MLPILEINRHSLKGSGVFLDQLVQRFHMEFSEIVGMGFLCLLPFIRWGLGIMFFGVVCPSVHTYRYVCLWVCVSVCAYVHVRVSVGLCVRLHMYVYVRLWVCVSVCAEALRLRRARILVFYGYSGKKKLFKLKVC